MQQDSSTIFRVVRSRENPYAQIYKGMLNDAALPWDSKGLIAYLLSKPDGWEVRFADLLRSGTAGRDALRRMIRDAIALGYMHRERANLDGGRFRWVTLVYEWPGLNPHFQGNLPSTAFPSMADPSMVEPSMADPSMVDPSMENPSIYQYISVVTNDGETTDGGTTDWNETEFDDDGGSSSLTDVVQEKTGTHPMSRVANRELAAGADDETVATVQAWTMAVVGEWLPEWLDAGEFLGKLDAAGVDAAARWIWAYHQLRGQPDYAAYAFETFQERNGDLFDGVRNPVGRIIEQVRRRSGPRLHEDDLRGLGRAIAAFADPGSILFGGEA